MIDNEPALPRRVLAIALIVLAALTALAVLAPDTVLMPVDLALQSLVLEQRTSAFTLLAVGTTMWGDFHLTTSLMLGLVVMLLAARRYWLALHALATFAGVKLSVAIMKTLVNRVRPVDLYPAGDTFSFPSGHVASAAVLFGVCAALLLARQRGGAGLTPGLRVTAIAALSMLAVMVAWSRVYLGAHWPSDVVASFALATLFVTAFNWQLARDFPLPPWLPKAVIAWLIGGYAAYALLRSAAEFERYRAAGSFMLE